MGDYLQQSMAHLFFGFGLLFTADISQRLAALKNDIQVRAQ